MYLLGCQHSGPPLTSDYRWLIVRLCRQIKYKLVSTADYNIMKTNLIYKEPEENMRIPGKYLARFCPTIVMLLRLYTWTQCTVASIRTRFVHAIIYTYAVTHTQYLQIEALTCVPTKIIISKNKYLRYKNSLPIDNTY